MRLKIAGFGAVLLLIAAIIFLQFSSAVLFKYKDPTSVDPADGLWVLLNPFRDRQPESTATAFLEKIKENKCEEALTYETGEDKSRICDKEREYKLIDWTLANRNDEETKTVLHFQAYRSGSSPDYWTNTWVTVEGKGGGRVTSFESWY